MHFLKYWTGLRNGENVPIIKGLTFSGCIFEKLVVLRNKEMLMSPFPSKTIDNHVKKMDIKL